jgi:hypothetical protein
MNFIYWIPPIGLALIVIVVVYETRTAPSIRDLRADEADSDAFMAQMDVIDQEQVR